MEGGAGGAPGNGGCVAHQGIHATVLKLKITQVGSVKHCIIILHLKAHLS